MMPLLFLVLLAACAVAYIPASPTNSSQAAIAGGLNMTDISKLRLQWYSNGNYVENVSYQLAGNGSDGISKGILIHFTEEFINESTPPTSAPWIAMVPCDANSTYASMEIDIFTLARDKGAVAALLYSLHSLACVINPEYTDPSTFDQVFDIFSTQSKTSAHLIDYQFGQLIPTNASITKYDSARLNNTAQAIQDSIRRGYATEPGFLYAELRAYNATGDSDGPSVGGVNTGNNNAGGSSSSNTALAMIVLYAITGCVSALFCVVIISGAIRALRHPERYGPRARIGLDGPPQSRARGLTRAILDTFPIVKFGGGGSNGESGSGQADIRGDQTKDAEAQELTQWEIVDEAVANGHAVSIAQNRGDNTRRALCPEVGDGPVASTSSPRPSTSRSDHQHDRGEGPSTSLTAATRSPRGTEPHDDIPVRDDLSPEAMGRETCPICIVDFEEGDDIRVLPCEGKHRFHPGCVDQWLLELSSSCPICRQDFLALASMISHDDEREGQEIGLDALYPDLSDHRHQQHPGSGSRRHGSTIAMYGNNRFSRYLRFATGRRHLRQQRERENQDDEHEETRPDGLSMVSPRMPQGTGGMYHQA